MKALIVGKGPLMFKRKNLETLVQSNYDGALIVVDAALKKCLEMGITPDKFKNFYVCAVEDNDLRINLMNHDIIFKYGKQIKAIISERTNHKVRKFFIEYVGFNELIEIKSPLVEVLPNVGIFGWLAAWNNLGCDDIGLLGLDTSWTEDDLRVPKDTELFHNHFKVYKNPFDDNDYYLDPLQIGWQEIYIEIDEHFSPEYVITHNLTGGGALYSKKTLPMNFEQWLAA